MGTVPTVLVVDDSPTVRKIVQMTSATRAYSRDYRKRWLKRSYLGCGRNASRYSP